MNTNKSVTELKQVINVTIPWILIGNKGQDAYIKTDGVKLLMCIRTQHYAQVKFSNSRFIKFAGEVKVESTSSPPALFAALFL